MVAVGSAPLLCFTPRVLRALLPLAGEPSTLADEIAVPPGSVRRYLAVWAVFSAAATFWGLSAWIDNPRPDLIEFLASLGRVAWVVMFLSSFAAALTLLGHLALLKVRRWRGRTRDGSPGRPTWDVIRAIGIALGGSWILSVVLLILLTLIEVVQSATWL